MMATRKLDKTEWQAYFDRVAKTLGARSVEIEVASLNLGHLVEADWVPLIGLSYDPRDDVLEVATEPVDHLIHHPREVDVDEQAEGLRAVRVVDADGNQQIISLKAPATLPPP